MVSKALLSGRVCWRDVQIAPRQECASRCACLCILWKSHGLSMGFRSRCCMQVTLSSVTFLPMEKEAIAPARATDKSGELRLILIVLGEELQRQGGLIRKV